jgi:hypothetical protein
LLINVTLGEVTETGLTVLATSGRTGGSIFTTFVFGFLPLRRLRLRLGFWFLVSRLFALRCRLRPWFRPRLRPWLRLSFLARRRFRP